jgi:hypothetical protein
LELDQGNDGSCEEIAGGDENEGYDQAGGARVEIADNVGADESSGVTNSINKSKAGGGCRLGQDHCRHRPKDWVVSQHNPRIKSAMASGKLELVAGNSA